SFDGPRDWHDKKRVRPGGLPTFDRVWSNLCALREIPTPFEVMVRLHADRDNVGILPKFIEQFGREFGGDSRFSLFIRNLGRFGGANDESLNVFEYEEGRKAVEDLRARASSHGIRLAPLGTGVSICYAAKGNSFLIGANGRVNKCTLAREHRANQVGTIREDGTMDLRAEKAVRWMRGFQTADAGELACPMKGLADPTPSAGIRLTIPATPPGAMFSGRQSL